MRHLPIIALAAILTACGGGGSSQAPAAQPQIQAMPCRSVQLFGDSTQLLAAPYWEARWPGLVTSNAVGMTKATQLLAGTDGVNKPWPQSVTADIVVIKHGTNDATPAYGETPIESYKQTLRTLYRSTSARVVFETPDPTLAPDRPDVPLYQAAMREVARELGATLIDTDACWRARPGWEAFLYDGTHATPEGRQYTVEQCVAPVMAAIGCGK